MGIFGARRRLPLLIKKVLIFFLLLLQRRLHHFHRHHSLRPTEVCKHFSAECACRARGFFLGARLASAPGSRSAPPSPLSTSSSTIVFSCAVPCEFTRWATRTARRFVVTSPANGPACMLVACEARGQLLHSSGAPMARWVIVGPPFRTLEWCSSALRQSKKK